MIGDGPRLIESLSGPLHEALQATLEAGEEIRIAVRSYPREAVAVTNRRLLLVREGKPVQALPLAALRKVRSEVQPGGGSLLWETEHPGLPNSVGFPPYDGAKFGQVAARIRRWSAEEERIVAAGSGETSDGARCSACGHALRAEESWCARCGRQVVAPCWECGRALLLEAVCCGFCGTSAREPALTACRSCGAAIGRRHAYCAACGALARRVCQACDEPLRSDWRFCPACGGEPAGAETLPAAAPVTVAPDSTQAYQLTPRTPEDAARLNEAGVRAFEAGNLREAVRLFEEASEADPGQSSYFTNLGVAYGELGDDLKAFSAYRRAVAASPTEITAYLHMGTLYTESERTTEAREAWEKVIKIAPDSEEAAEARENLRHLDSV